MAKPLHILICGEVGVGKSTLIRKLLTLNERPLYGFLTKRLKEDENGIAPVCIYPPTTTEFTFIPENQVGICVNNHAQSNIDVFNTLGVEFLKSPKNGLILMDEIGFMESKADSFCDYILNALDGDVPVLAAVKTKDTPFLEKIRSHFNANLYVITEENRDSLFNKIAPKIEIWNNL